MKRQILTIAAISALMLASCGGGNSNSNSASDQDSSATQEATLDDPTEEQSANGWKFQKPSTDIAKEIWDKYYKKKNNNADISSIQNVICDYDDVETIEYDEGGMVNIFKRTKIACFQHDDGYWHVVELHTEFCSDGCDEEYTIKHFKYQNGKLTEIKDTEGLYESLEEAPSYIYNPECAPSYLVLSLEMDGSSPKAFNWDGSKFVVGQPTIAQFISEEDLFNKVAAENPLLKGKKIDIGFSSDYAEWQRFSVNNTSFSYGRYKLNEGGYAIYLRARKDEGKATVYKYTFTNGELKYVSDKDFFKEIGDPDAAGKDIDFTSNPYFQGLSVDRDNFSWNGETWVKGEPTPSYDDEEADSGFQMPDTDIASEVWKIAPRGKSQVEDCKRMGMTVNVHENGSESNVIYTFTSNTEYANEESDGEIEREEMNTYIGCYQNDKGYWNVVEYFTIINEQGHVHPEILFFKYENGKLEEVDSFFDSPNLKDEDELYHFIQEEPSIETTTITLFSRVKGELYMQWNGSKFVEITD